MLSLRRLMGDAVDMELVAPNDDLVYRPLAVREPFSFGPPRRYSLRRIARDAGAEWIRDTLGWVDRDARAVHTGEGRRSGVRRTCSIAVGADRSSSTGTWDLPRRRRPTPSTTA